MEREKQSLISCSTDWLWEGSTAFRKMWDGCESCLQSLFRYWSFSFSTQTRISLLFSHKIYEACACIVVNDHFKSLRTQRNSKDIFGDPWCLYGRIFGAWQSNWADLDSNYTPEYVYNWFYGFTVLLLYVSKARIDMEKTCYFINLICEYFLGQSCQFKRSVWR